MHLTDRHYLTKLSDETQYTVVRCAMGENICMFSKSASSGVESMNRANQLAQQKTAVDILNWIIMLLKIEGEWFEWYKEKAWEWDNILTEKGLALMEESFENVNVREYCMTISPIEDEHRATVGKSTNKSTKFTVVIPTEG